MSRPALPYCTVKGFLKALRILASPPRPERVERTWLIERGLSPHAVYPILGALRFLGIVDASDNLTPRLDAFLEDDLAARHAILAEAYAPLLATISFPVHEREDVDRLLVEEHGCAPGVVAFCSTFFLWLAAEAGMPVTVLGRSRRGRPPAHLSQLSNAARTRLLERAAAMAADGIGTSARGGDPTFGPAERGREVMPRPSARDAGSSTTTH